MRPRAWVDELKRFRADNVGLCGGDQSHLLTCTNWRNAHREESTANEDRFKSGCYDDIVVTVSTEDHPLNSKDETVDDDYSLLLLLFFRDISRDQRLKILVNLEAIPPDWTGTLSEAFERGAFDGLVKDGRIDELRSEIRKVALV